MIILSIETSCDETAISLLKAKSTKKETLFTVLANTISSQIKVHAPYGGVFPALAKREHIKNLPILLNKVLKKSKLTIDKVELLTVTYGPGLEPTLWTGIVFAKEIAEKNKIPLVPVNHMEGHIFSVFAKDKGTFKIPKLKLPALSLLISGGHTELVLIKDSLNYQIIGETLDDASGEAFDKVARMMNLPYPGGPEISRLGDVARKSKEASPTELSGMKLPRPMMYSKDFNFSFSGLKTAVLYLIRDLKQVNYQILENIKIKQAIALEFENAVTETLIYKTKRAINKYGAKTLIVAGGVSANKYLKSEINKEFKKDLEVIFPNKNLTGDNSIMIALAGYFQYVKSPKKFSSKTKIKAEGNLRLK